MLYEFITPKCIYCNFVTIVTKEKGICKNKDSINYDKQVSFDFLCNNYLLFKLAEISINGEALYIEENPIPTWKNRLRY